MTPTDELTAKREPNNPYDANAIALFHRGTQVGHLARELAESLAPLLDTQQANIRVFIEELTGGEPQIDFFSNNPKEKTKNRGCNIRIEVEYAPDYMKQFLEGSQ